MEHRNHGIQRKDNEIQGLWNAGIMEYRDNRVQGQ